MSLVPRPLRGVLGTDDDLVSQEQAPHLARGRARARAGARARVRDTGAGKRRRT